MKRIAFTDKGVILNSGIGHRILTLRVCAALIALIIMTGDALSQELLTRVFSLLTRPVTSYRIFQAAERQEVLDVYVSSLGPGKDSALREGVSYDHGKTGT